MLSVLSLQPEQHSGISHWVISDRKTPFASVARLCTDMVMLYINIYIHIDMSSPYPFTVEPIIYKYSCIWLFIGAIKSSPMWLHLVSACIPHCLHPRAMWKTSTQIMVRIGCWWLIQYKCFIMTKDLGLISDCLFLLSFSARVGFHQVLLFPSTFQRHTNPHKHTHTQLEVDLRLKLAPR